MKEKLLKQFEAIRDAVIPHVLAVSRELYPDKEWDEWVDVVPVMSWTSCNPRVMSAEFVDDGTPQIHFNERYEWEDWETYETVVHELVHWVCKNLFGWGVGHRNQFVVIGKALGLRRPYTQIGGNKNFNEQEYIKAVMEKPEVRMYTSINVGVK